MNPGKTLAGTDALLALINRGLAELPLTAARPAALYEPMAYVLGMKAKRLRPLLVLLAYQAYSEQKPERCLQTALAIELFHNFTLVHDDIMDNAPTRRGLPTVHARWDSSTAILSGDALFALGIRMVVEEFPAEAGELIHIFAEVALRVCEGQMEDMALAHQPHACVADYIEMIRKKTAALLGGSLQMGAAAAGAAPEIQALLQQFGEKAGIAFQLQDDLLDVYAPTEKFGKQPGGDIIENKKTYLWLRAFALADPPRQAELTRWITVNNRNEEKVAAVKAIFDALNIQTETQTLINTYFAQAQALIRPLLANPGILLLEQFLQQLMQREL